LVAAKRGLPSLGVFVLVHRERARG